MLPGAPEGIGTDYCYSAGCKENEGMEAQIGSAEEWKASVYYGKAAQEAASRESLLIETDSSGVPIRFAVPEDADSLADALIAGQLSPRTRRAYAADLTELLACMKTWDLTLTEVTRDHLHAWRSWLAGEEAPGLTTKPKKRAPATVSRKVSVCRQFFDEAFDRGLISRNPAARLRGFAVSHDSKTLGLSKQQAKDLLEAVGIETLLGLRDKAMLSLMIRTGLRRMDVIGATVGSLGEHLGHTTLTILSKGNKERAIKIPVEVSRHLDAWRSAAKEYREEKAGTPLFCGVVKTGQGKASYYNVREQGQKPLSEKAIWKIVLGRVKAAGIGGNITPHSTRHTFITLALDGGAPLHKVQAAAGHADPRTTERYWRTKHNLDDNAVDYIRL